MSEPEQGSGADRLQVVGPGEPVTTEQETREQASRTAAVDRPVDVTDRWADPAAADLRFSERLSVPLSWWLIAGFFLFTFLVATGFYLGPWLGLAITAAVSTPVVWVLLAWGSARITLDETAITVEGRRLEWQWVAGVRALDAAETKRRAGTEADARALLVLRAYLPESVQIDLDDPADPHPYWLVSTRHPDQLAALAERALRRTGEDSASANRDQDG